MHTYNPVRSTLAYYSREIRSLLLLAAAAAIFTYRQSIAAAIFSEKGMTVLLGLVLAGVLSLVIRIYYRVIVIRYYKPGKRG
jgi:hypothetical protein